MLAGLLRHGGIIGAGALVAGLLILAIDWLTVLDSEGERIRESIVADIGGAALVVTGLFILWVLWRQKADARDFQTEGVAAEAEIEDMRLGFYGTDITIRFTDALGQEHRAHLAGNNLATRPGFGPGTRLAIRYDPANPRRLRFQDTLDRLAPRA
ncbi:hypothetical protein HKCCE3408_19375 [Rhodobacterales bacterium HKCCE3408]|nr:hypothetical protein [Rhodobacterales bacterium HKCCE3408]